MEWSRYKTLCDRPDYWPRWFLLRLIDLAGAAGDETLQQRLQVLLTAAPLEKPADHRGDERTDVFSISLEAGDVVALRALVDHFEGAPEKLPKSFAGRGLGGFAEALKELADALALPPAVTSAHGNNSTEQETLMGGAGETVQRMIDAFNRIDVEGILECFAEDAVYHNMPMEPITGTEGIRAALGTFLGDASEVDWVVTNLLENSDGTVLTERVDRFLIKGHWLELPVMGTFEVVDGRIRAWRDYFDLADFQQQFAKAQGGA